MPFQTNDTMTFENVQASYQDDWTTEILPRLPNGFQEKARELKAFQRSREISTPEDLLRGLLASVFVTQSFQLLGIWSVVQQIAEISANDWRKRLRNSADWLTWLLQEVLAASTQVSPWLVRTGWTRILLIDGTHLKCYGPDSMTWRIHTAFDLLQGRISQVKVTDTHVAEQLSVYDLGPGDLVVGDSATGYAERLTYVHDHDADLVTRFTPSTLPLYDEYQHRIDVTSWLKGRHARAGMVCHLDACIEREEVIGRKKKKKGEEKEKIPVRVIALKLSKEQKTKAERKKHEKAVRKQRKLSDKTIYLAGWILLVTTLPKEQWGDEDILRLYKARWHIELLFKRIKQLLKTHRLRCKTMETARATIAALLLGWVLIEEGSQQMRQSLTEAMLVMEAESTAESHRYKDLTLHASWWEDGERGALSEWRLVETTMSLFKDQVKGTYTAKRVRACLQQLKRFLHQGPRKRELLYRRVCQWLVLPATVQEEFKKRQAG